MGTICQGSIPCFQTRDPEMADGEGVARRADSLRINKQINEDIKLEKKKLRNTYKILLLGCGEAGKSTFIKQMKIIHSGEDEGGWSDEDKQKYRKEILVNVIQCLQILLEETTEELETSLINTAARIRELDPDDERDHGLLWGFRDNIQAIWEDSAVQETFNRRNEYNLPDCCRYFLSNIQRITAPTFVPESRDILQVRVKTTGVIEYNFPTEGGKEFIMIDVGGQRTERKKWIHCFEDVLLIMFLAAISEYDQVLEEDHNQNRLEESLNLFGTILSYHWFRNSSFTLFLNKKDLLAEKIQSSPLEAYFPSFKDFKGFTSGDYDSAKSFMRHLFRQRKAAVENTRHFKETTVDGSTRSLFIHETCATDTDNVKKVFSDVKVHIMRLILEPYGTL